jgi:hypothetical protein
VCLFGPTTRRMEGLLCKVDLYNDIRPDMLGIAAALQCFNRIQASCMELDMLTTTRGVSASGTYDAQVCSCTGNASWM